MKIEIAEAGPADGYPDALRIYVGNDWMKAKRCGPGVQVSIGAAGLRNEEKLNLIDKIIDGAFLFQSSPPSSHHVILLYDPGHTTEAMALLDMVHKRLL